MHNVFQENRSIFQEGRYEKIKIPDSGRLTCTVKLRYHDTPLMRSFEYKIDTGADFTTVSKDVLDKLNYSEKWINENMKLSEGSTTVATGEDVESYYIIIPAISIYGVKGWNYPLNILKDKKEELPKPTCKDCEYTLPKKLDYRLLLGNDILSCFNIMVDKSTGWLYMERLNNLEARNAIYPDRQLNFVENE